MEALVIQPRNKRYMPKFAKAPKTARNLDDAFFIALTEEIENGLKPQNANVRGEDLWEAVESGNISPDVVDDFEDAVLGQMMIEGSTGEYVSREEVMKILDE